MNRGSGQRHVRAIVVFTRWDATVLARASLVAGLTLALAWLVTAATDEGGVPWGERAGRTLPLTPICAAIGVWAALAPLQNRGEVRALAALGRSRIQIAAAAVAGGALVAMAAAIVVGTLTSVDVAGFYPMAVLPGAWQWQGGAFVNRAQALLVGADGAPARLTLTGDALPGLAANILAATPATIPPGARAAAALATAIAGTSLPMLLAHLILVRNVGGAGARQGGRWRARRGAPDRILVMVAAGMALAASVMLFQAAAARLAPAILATLPSVGLLAFAIDRYRVWP